MINQIVIEIKCPYCYCWISLTQRNYDLYDAHQCPECFSVFRVDDTVIKYI